MSDAVERAKPALEGVTEGIEAFDIFIRRNIPIAWHGHFLDNDENDGQFVRDHVEDLAAEVSRLRAQETRIRELCEDPSHGPLYPYKILAALDTEGEQ
ncbi:hypothetical protein SEA_LATRETIUM_87 [Mycobacterium phage Latretium]|uniref:Uncharacterized protein n=1 Tax=Mycobacterium phage Dante TaxID=1698357 RepID=A0A0K1Y7A8_9CAUD|nr:hypothetical protein AVV07_gp084 [Mycobacterium phage Dante]AKY02995.1 hypothetical protein SEA_DANTE_84 [Mycobacterium phage Dante]QXO12887.1 hypothetical protein SEA_LATRETIUM_87 [Mycobacterium phage Latretium]